MTGLNLIPNEVVGYRIHPDYHNWTVVLVKRYGPNSKQAGQEYETALAYCATLPSAVAWIINHVARVEGDRLQTAQFAKTGETASLEALAEAIKTAQREAMAATEDLERRFAKSEFSRRLMFTQQARAAVQQSQDEAA